MLGRKARTIRRLRRHNEVLTGHNEQLMQERDAAVYVNGRLASQLDEATSRPMARTGAQAEGLFTRAMGLLRLREQRHRAVVTGLKRELTAARIWAAREKERADKLDDRLRRLERANQDFDWRPAIHPEDADMPTQAAA